VQHWLRSNNWLLRKLAVPPDDKVDYIMAWHMQE
jgi:hypothetical protein